MPDDEKLTPATRNDVETCLSLEHLLGVMYALGRGVQKDLVQPTPSCSWPTAMA